MASRSGAYWSRSDNSFLDGKRPQDLLATAPERVIEAVALDPFRLPLAKQVFEFTQLKGIPGAVRDAAPDAWGRRVIEHKLERSPADLQEIDDIVAVVKQWKESFFACGVSAKDIEHIAPAMLPECFFFERQPDA